MIPFIDLHPVQTTNRIEVPNFIHEESGLQGFAFSRNLVRAPDLERFAAPKTDEERRIAHDVATNAGKIAEEMDGGPGVGENYIEIKISDSDANAGSRVENLYLYFDSGDKFLRLWGKDDGGHYFPRGWQHQWNMNVGTTDPENWIETVPTDAWDNLLLVNKSGDGILIDNIKVVHSSFTIVDWPPPGESVWLDGSIGQKYGIIGLADQILQKKLEAIPANVRWISQLHWAALELGKTDGRKYGTIYAWCSEFASWCLRKSGWWDAPMPLSDLGDRSSKAMERYFKRMNRMFTKDDLLNSRYTLTEGDYLRFDGHSALFVRYESDGRALTDPRKRFISIDGNWSSAVSIAQGEKKEIRDLVSVGCTG